MGRFWLGRWRWRWRCRRLVGRGGDGKSALRVAGSGCGESVTERGWGVVVGFCGCLESGVVSDVEVRWKDCGDGHGAGESLLVFHVVLERSICYGAASNGDDVFESSHTLAIRCEVKGVDALTMCCAVCYACSCGFRCRDSLFYFAFDMGILNHSDPSSWSGFFDRLGLSSFFPSTHMVDSDFSYRPY